MCGGTWWKHKCVVVHGGNINVWWYMVILCLYVRWVSYALMNYNKNSSFQVHCTNLGVVLSFFPEAYLDSCSLDPNITCACKIKMYCL